MDVKAQIKILLALQGLDAEIIAINKSLKALPERLNEMHRDVAALEELLAKEQEALDQEDRWKREKEEEHQFLEAQIVKIRKQMQESTAHRETLALQRQLDTSRKQAADMEDEILQTMQAVDARRAQVEARQGDLVELKERFSVEEEEIRGEMDRLQAELGRLKTRREEGSVGLETSVKRRYDQIASRRHPSVVEAVDGHCTGCNMAILPQLYNTLYYANSMEFCPICQRMIYLKSAVFCDEEGSSGAPKADDTETSSGEEGADQKASG